MAASGELLPAIDVMQEVPRVVPLTCLAAVMGYISVMFVLLLIAHFGATTTEIVKSTRKVVSIILSFLIYPKPVTWKYILGGILTAMSLAMTYYAKKRKAAEKDALRQGGDN